MMKSLVGRFEMAVWGEAMPSRRLSSLLLSAALVSPFGCWQSARAADAAMIEAAKKEGSVVWYTAQIINQVATPLAQAFEARYGVKVSPIRADVNDVVLRITAEAKAGKPQADVFDGTAAAPPLKRAGYVLKWLPDGAKDLPDQYKDPEGYWVANNVYIIVPAFNTQLVPPGTQPKVWNDLLDPKYKGRIAISGLSSSSSGPGFVGNVLHDLGEEKGHEFLKRLATQDVKNIYSSARAVVDQVMAGEFAIGLQTFNHQSVISAKLGAPVDWIRWSPAVASLSVASVVKDSPHPNAAKLFLDFLISEEGQKIFADADYIPTNPKVPAKAADLKPEVGGFSAYYLPPETLDENIGKWGVIFKSYFK